MTALILLSAANADAVRGRSSTVEGAALDPIATADGRFALPLAVLADPAHAVHHALLAGLPTAEADTVTWPVDE